MKVTLDLDALKEAGEITDAEYERLQALGHRNTHTLALNLLIAFGVVAVALGAAVLIRNVALIAIIGLVLLLGGALVQKKHRREWLILSQVLLLTGALMFGGAQLASTGAYHRESYLLVAFVYAAGAWFAHSGLLAALATVALGGIVGAGTAYSHATYFFWTRTPMLTIALFAGLGFGLWWLAGKLVAEKRRILIIAARTSIFMVMLGFWIGSLWGDRSFYRWNGVTGRYEGVLIPGWPFSLLWAVALIGAMWWAWKQNHRWLLNTAAVFTGIHLYTQFFEYFKFNPASLLLAGLLRLNRHMIT